jgi:NADPH-dependent ferric siderophore reductase
MALLGPRDLVLSRATVEETRWITRRMKHIRLAGDDLIGIPWKPGQQLRVQVNRFLSLASLRSALRDAVRTYSVWSCDPRRGVLDLGVLVQGSGPGSAWAERARRGDPVAFFGPTGSFVARPEAKRHFFFGDETAAFAFEAMVRSLPDPSSACCCLEAPGPDDEVPARGPGFAAVWLQRGEGAAGSGLLDAVRKLSPPAASGVAYVAGELSACRAIRDALVAECGFARRDVRVKPFWAPGRKGLE